MRRLTFVVRNGVIELLAEQEVDMQPLTLPEATGGARHAFWYEVRDSANKTLIVQPEQDPLPKDLEVFSEDRSRTIRRAPDPRNEHAFTVVLPSVEGADSVVLMRAAPPPSPALTASAAGSAPGTEVARFQLANK